MKIVRAIRQGRILPAKPKTSTSDPNFYAIWSTAPSDHPTPLPAPKPRLPTHSESYNPPAEYLPSDAERAEWEATDKEDRERDYLPQKYSALRLVPAYDQFIHQRFSRLLDLYLAPRIQRKKLNIDPESLIPKLPSPSSLKPFPNYRALRFPHELAKVRCVSVSPDGAWVVSGDDKGVVRLWEVLVGREVKRWKFKGTVGAVEWCPRTDVSYFVVGVCGPLSSKNVMHALTTSCREDHLQFLMPPNLPPDVMTLTLVVLAPASLPPAPATPSPIKWISVSAATADSNSPILSLNLPMLSGLPKQIVWHRRGDYLASVCEQSHFTSYLHSRTVFRWLRPRICLDPPSHPQAFPGPVPESQGFGTARAVPPHKTTLLRRSECIHNKSILWSQTELPG